MWSLVVGLAGGWLVLSPWALGLQGGGDWTNATKTEVGTGLFLVLIGVVGLVLVIVDVLGRFREVGLIVPKPAAEPVPEPAPQPAATSGDVDMDGLLSVLAKVLAEEVSRRGDNEHPAPQEQRPETWRSQS
jgi:hypothetical protein